MTTLDHRPAAFVETPTGPAVPLPAPPPKVRVIEGVATDMTNPHRIGLLGAAGTLGVAVSGLVWTALHHSDQPALIMWPIGAALATTALTCVNAFRHDVWEHRNHGPHATITSV
jgi:hypothetical protein